MLKGANIEGEDEQEDAIQDMEGLFCYCKNHATLHLSRIETAGFRFSLLRIKRNSAGSSRLDFTSCCLAKEPAFLSLNSTRRGTFTGLERAADIELRFLHVVRVFVSYLKKKHKEKTAK